MPVGPGRSSKISACAHSIEGVIAILEDRTCDDRCDPPRSSPLPDQQGHFPVRPANCCLAQSVGTIVPPVTLLIEMKSAFSPLWSLLEYR